MNDETRAALVEELEAAVAGRLAVGIVLNRLSSRELDCVKTGDEIVDKAVMPIVDRLLAERDIDAMLNAVHPRARINYLGYHNRRWEAYLWTPEFLNAKGTGPTRVAAIADACRKAKAKEVQHGTR